MGTQYSVQAFAYNFIELRLLQTTRIKTALKNECVPKRSNSSQNKPFKTIFSSPQYFSNPSLNAERNEMKRNECRQQKSFHQQVTTLQPVTQRILQPASQGGHSLNLPPNHSPSRLSSLVIKNLMGDFCRAGFVAPYLFTHQGSISIAGKPQPLDSILAHEFAERALWGSANFGNKIGFDVTAVFSIDEFPIG